MRGTALGVAGLTALAVMTTAGSAGAAAVTVGSPMTAGFTQTQTHYVGTAINGLLPEAGANVASPVSGAVRRWRFQGTGQHKLRVLRPNGDGTYTGVATSAPVTGTGTQTATSDVLLPIQAGDLVGIDDSSANDTIGIASVPGAAYSFWIPGLADGAAGAPTSTFPGGEFAFNADVVPAPAITSVGPAAGPAEGGNAVVLRGTDFTEASGVTFGGVAARSFTVDSGSQITAIAPAGAPGVVDVRVTTPSGTSPVADADRYLRAAAPGSSAGGAPSLPALPALPGAPNPIAGLGDPQPTGHGVSFTVACEGPAGGYCRVVTRLVVRVVMHHGSKRVVRTASVRKAKRAYRAYRAYGSRKAKIATGHQKTITVQLNRQGRALLKRAKSLKVRVTRAYTAPNGAKMTLPTRQVVIKR